MSTNDSPSTQPHYTLEGCILALLKQGSILYALRAFVDYTFTSSGCWTNLKSLRFPRYHNLLYCIVDTNINSSVLISFCQRISNNQLSAPTTRNRTHNRTLALSPHHRRLNNFVYPISTVPICSPRLCGFFGWLIRWGFVII